MAIWLGGQSAYSLNEWRGEEKNTGKFDQQDV